MSQPEIARRCPSCGVSIREAAFFCPQCGRELPQRDLSETQPIVIPPPSTAGPANPNRVAEVERSGESGRDTQPDLPVQFKNESQKKARQRRRKEAALKASAARAGEMETALLHDPPPGTAPLPDPQAATVRLKAPADSATASLKAPADTGTAPLKAAAGETGKASVGQAARGAVGAQIHRAGNLARGVEGDVVQRARKVRQMSSVVIDEAGGDPSLRFVLVAAVLFVLFLVIVVLNKFIS